MYFKKRAFILSISVFLSYFFCLFRERLCVCYDVECGAECVCCPALGQVEAFCKSVSFFGTSGSAGWDAADRSNFTSETYARIISLIREILDDVRPVHAFYCIEPMPWMVPDSPESYLRLIHDVDRPQFGAHMDFVNMINCPRRYLAPEDFIESCFRILKPYIKSTHIKDTRMNPTRLTAMLEECSPGEGTLDYARVLRIMDQFLPSDAPVLLEHMQTAEEYRTAYDYVAGVAALAGISV